MNTINEIRDVLNEKNYVFFDNQKPFNLNLIGVRMETHVKNTFDDKLFLVFRDEKLRMKINEYPITTDPGSYWLLHPMNKDGCGIMVPGQYRGLWAKGKHHNKYDALVQVGLVKAYRDNNLDDVLDFDPATIQIGRFGANCHMSNPYTESYYVDKWSAMCQVHKKSANHWEMMAYVDLALKLYPNSFTYTLLEEKDF